MSAAPPRGGSYGDCFECGEEISEARLRALPFAVRCKDARKRARARAARAMLARREGPSAFLFDSSN